MPYIKIEVPSDDVAALFLLGKSLVEMSGALGDTTFKIIDSDEYDSLTRLRVATEELQQAAPRMMGEQRFDGEELSGKRKEVKVDTTGEQYEALQGQVKAEHVEPVTTPSIDTDSNGTPWDERIHSTSKARNADGTWRLRRKPKDIDEAEWAALIEVVKAETMWTSCDPEVLEKMTDAGMDTSGEPPVDHHNTAYMYQESLNVYALGRSKEEIDEYEAKGYVRHTQEQYDAWEGPTTVDEGDDLYIDVGVVTEQTVAGIPPLPVPPPIPEVVAPPIPEVVAPPVPEVASWDFPRLMTFLTERHGKIDVAAVNTLLAQDGLASLQELSTRPDKIGPFVARVKAHLGE